MPAPKPHEALAVKFFGASHCMRGIYQLPDGEYCLADGVLYAQDVIDEWHGIYSCWGCGGSGVQKMYLHRGYTLAACDICHGEKTSGLMPALKPRHVHEWEPAGEEKPGWEPQRCDCGAVWLKRSERVMASAMLAGMKPLASLLGREKEAT